MNDDDVLRLWKRVAGDDSEEEWTEDSVFAFFQRFRPSGTGVEAALRPLVRGEEVLARLELIYGATGEGRGDPADPYFVVRNPPRSKPRDLEWFARLQATCWREIAREQGKQWLVDRLALDKIEITDTEPPLPDDDSPETAVHDVESRWHVDLRSICLHDFVLREAFYSIACDYYLAKWVTWPWYSDSTKVYEPYEPAFELWRRGVRMLILRPHHAVLYLTRSR